MSNKSDKPKQTSVQLLQKMKDKGITFHNVSEEEAIDYLTNRNNYLRTAAYRKNYQKYQKGTNKGKYIGLDFSYLTELSTIDMHFRFLINKMCSDIEHDLKVRMLKDVENDETTDGYDIVEHFLSQNNYIIHKLEATSASPFTCDLIQKYFKIEVVRNEEKDKEENKIVDYSDCPVWVLVELLTFGDFIKFYKFYYENRPFQKIPAYIINLVKSLRNGVAHNNCVLADLSHNTSNAPLQLQKEVAKIYSINENQRRKKLSCRPMLEFVALLYVYNQVVSAQVRYNRTKEVNDLFFSRMIKHQEFFSKNELITSNYKFACKCVQYFLR